MKLLFFIKRRALVFILVLYLIIASAGLFFNYSLFNTTGDEAPLLSATLKMIADRSLRPNYPSFYHLSLGAYFYLPFFLIWLMLMRLSGLFPNLPALEQFGQIEFAKFLPLARFISVLAGLACLYLLYKICEKLFNNRLISWLATFFLSASLLFVQASHFARIWILQVMTILLAFYFIINLYQAEKTRLKNYLLCGLGVGLAFGAHVVGVFIYVSFLAAHYLKNKNEKIYPVKSRLARILPSAKLFNGVKQIIFNKYFWQANLAFAIVYFIVYYLNPYGFTRYLGGVLLNPNKMLSLSGTFDLLTDRPDIADQSGTAASAAKMLVFYLKALWQYETLILLSAVFGAAVLFIKKQRDILLIIFSFIVVYGLAISSISMKSQRYLLPIMPFLAMLAAYGLAWFYQRAKNKKIIGGLIVIFCLLLLYPPLLWDYKFLLPSSRLATVNWIYKNLPPGESIINLDQGLELNENRQSLLDIKKYSKFLTKKRAYLLNSPDQIFPQPNYYVFFYPHYAPQAPAEILKKKFNYLIISWWDKNNFLAKLAELEKLNLAEKDLILIKRFPAEATENDIGLDLGGSLDRPLKNLPKLKQNGPIVDIYKIKY